MTTTANRVERRLVLVVGAVVFVDTMFYAAIAPLLPGLAKELHLSKLSAGALTASYAAGRWSARFPAACSAARVGPKKTVFVGLALLAVSTLAFGFLNNAALLDVARFAEGLGGACSWAGGLAWIVAEAPVEPSRSADRRCARRRDRRGPVRAGDRHPGCRDRPGERRSARSSCSRWG